MKLKRFIASDTRTAMQQIKAELGPDAVILSSSQVGDEVEIVAAIDFDETIVSKQAAIESAKPSTQKSQNSANATSPIDDMRHEIQTMRSMLETQMRMHVSGGEPLHLLLLQKLQELGTSYKTSTSVISRINPQLNQNQAWEQVLGDLAIHIPINNSRRIEEGGIYAFVGPTGVGKTTTLAKIAARFALRFGAENLGLITMDTYRIAAEEQLVMYGKILGVPVCVAKDEAALERTIRQLSDKKLILIDTAGMSPTDERLTQQMELLGSKIQDVSTVLVLPATSQYQVLIDAILRSQACCVEQCIITKLDEALAIGGVISAIAETGIQVSYLTNGQRVPEDIKMATPHQLIEQLSAQEKQLNERQSQSNSDARRTYVEA